MPSQWINFRELKDSLPFDAVLRLYGVEPQPRGPQGKPGNQHTGFCPLPGHQGQRKSPSFSANLQTKIFQCFGCGAKGNILEFAVLMEGLNPDDNADFRKVCLQLRESLLGKGTGQNSEKVATSQLSTKTAPKPAAAEITAETEESPTPGALLNPPLDFTLKNLVKDHPYLAQRGIEPATTAHFGLGVCQKGLMADRLAIPLRNQAGELIGYAGRLIDDAKVSPNTPRYRFPSTREKAGQRLEFHKSLFLYNGYGIAEPVEELIVVEGFPSVWWLWQHGWPHTVATMGASISDTQAELLQTLVKPGGRIWLLPDADPAGDRFGAQTAAKLSQHAWVRWAKLTPPQQPTDLGPEELRMLFQG